jgi:hypothetical protein
MIDHPLQPCSIAAPDWRRRRLLQCLPALSIGASAPAMSTETPALLRRPIPRSGELLPVVGLGTYVVLDVGANAPEMTELREVMREFVAGGASVVDSSPMYGAAEARVGDLSAASTRCAIPSA